jgi:outer membrane protein assembly factor BamB
MFALDAATGAILWQFGAGSSVNSIEYAAAFALLPIDLATPNRP